MPAGQRTGREPGAPPKRLVSSLAAYTREDCEIADWRTRSGAEVNFIVYGSNGFWAIEVKNSAVVRGEDLRSLRAFVSDYPECEPILVYRGSDRLMVNGVRCMPAHEFLVALRAGRGVSDSTGAVPISPG